MKNLLFLLVVGSSFNTSAQIILKAKAIPEPGSASPIYITAKPADPGPAGAQVWRL